MERIYSTVMGVMNGMPGGGGTGGGTGRGSVGDGSDDGSNNMTQLNKIQNIGFGGEPANAPDREYTDMVCEDAQTYKVKDKCVQTTEQRWQDADYVFQQSVGRLIGEKRNGGSITKSSRVLLNGQSNRTENGIWITNSGAWNRASDARVPSHFKEGKVIVIENKKFRYSSNSYPSVE